MTTLWGRLPSWSSRQAQSHDGRCRPFCPKCWRRSRAAIIPLPIASVKPDRSLGLRWSLIERSINLTSHPVSPRGSSQLIIYLGPKTPYSDHPMWPMTSNLAHNRGTAEPGEYKSDRTWVAAKWLDGPGAEKGDVVRGATEDLREGAGPDHSRLAVSCRQASHTRRTKASLIQISSRSRIAWKTSSTSSAASNCRR